MLIRASGPLNEDLFLLTLGASARYLFMPSSGSVALIDPGASVHCDALLQRLAQLEVTPNRIGYIFLTHVHADRAGAVGKLKQLNPHIQVFGSAAMQQSLASGWNLFAENDRQSAAIAGASSIKSTLPHFEIDRVVVEGEVVTIAPETTIRVLSSTGHSSASYSYFLEPHRFLFGDEVLGYFRGRDLAAPGCDHSAASSIETIKMLLDIDIATLCLPYIGALTGELVQRHLQSVRQTTEDVLAESKRARDAGIAIEEIKSQIEKGLYSTDLQDPLFKASLRRSFRGFWEQIEASLSTST